MRRATPLSLLFTATYIGLAFLIGWVTHSQGAFIAVLLVGVVTKLSLQYSARRR